MAENARHSKASEKRAGDLTATWYGSLKEAVSGYLDTSEEWARRSVEWNERMTAWANDTPLAPVFETQRSFAKQWMDIATTLARRLWQIEAKTEEKEAL